MENDAAVEIEIGRLRHLLLDDFQKLLAKPSASHIFHRPDDHEATTKTGHFICYKTRTFSFATDTYCLVNRKLGNFDAFPLGRTQLFRYAFT